MKIADNRLLTGLVVALGAYWAAGLYLPWSSFAAIINLSLTVASGLLFMRFAPEAAAIVFQGIRNDDKPDGDGSHLAILGTTLIALGGILAAIAAFLMVYVAKTPFELFGRATAMAGIGMIFISPSVTKRGITFTSRWWLYLAAAIVMVGVYALGYNTGWHNEKADDLVEDAHIPDDRPRCASNRPVWISSNGRYHTRSSPDRRKVIPVRCYPSAMEAAANGYRPPG